MKYTMIGRRNTLLLILPLLSCTKASTEFTISESGVTCSGDFTVDSLKIDCGGGYCTFGSDVNVEGSLTIVNDLSTDTPKVTVTVANMVDIYKDEVDLCKVLSSTDGSSECPSAGSYNIDSFQFKIPGDGEQWYAQGGYWGTSLVLKASFYFGSSSSVCTTSVTLSKNNGYQMVAGALAVLGFAATLSGIRRKRRIGTIHIAEGEGTMSHFEMMPNDASARV